MSKVKLSKEQQQIAGKIRLIRENSGYTQEQFSELLGISASALKKIESGENQVSVSCLRKLNDTMSVSADWILFDKKADADSAWESIGNCSETDKLYLLLRLLHYFTGTKKSVYTTRDEQQQYSEEIKQFMEHLEDKQDN